MALHCDFLTRGIQTHEEKCSARFGTERGIYFTCGLVLCNSALWQTDGDYNWELKFSLSPMNHEVQHDNTFKY